MSGTPTPGFQRRPRRPLASGSFAAATGVRMLKTQKQGTPDGVTRHFAPASLWRPATHLPGTVIPGRSQASGSPASLQASARGQQRARGEAPAPAQRVAKARSARRPGRERGGDGGHAACGARGGAGRARACAARERARSPGRARGWLLVGVEEGDTAR